MTTALEKRRQKSPSQDTTGRGTWTGEPLPSGQDSGERDRLTQAWLPRGLFPEGSAVFLLAPGGKFFQTLSPGPGAGRRGIQPQPPFLKTQRMTRNMTMMPMTANNGPGI